METKTSIFTSSKNELEKSLMKSEEAEKLLLAMYKIYNGKILRLLQEVYRKYGIEENLSNSSKFEEIREYVSTNKKECYAETYLGVVAALISLGEVLDMNGFWDEEKVQSVLNSVIQEKLQSRK